MVDGINRLFVLLFLFLFTMISHPAYADVTVTIPHMEGLSGDQITIPVQVDDLTGLDVFAIGLEINYDNNVIEAREVVIESTLVEPWGQPTLNIQTGGLILAAAGASPLQGSGDLLKITFEILGSPGQSTPIDFFRMIFNEGEPNAVTQNGSLTIPQPTPVLDVEPNSLNFDYPDVAQVPEKQTIQIRNNGDGTLTWTAAKTHSWLVLSASSGTAPSTIDVTVDTTQLFDGQYEDTIVINAADAENSPQNISVELTVSADVASDFETTPYEYQLENYPNPFNPSTHLSYYLPKATTINLAIFDMCGRWICTVDHGFMDRGAHSVTWQGVDSRGMEVPSGLYVARLKADDVKKSIKIMKTK